MVDPGVTVIGLLDPIRVPPHEPVYQYIVDPLIEADKLVELPAQIVPGEAVGEGLSGTGLIVTVTLPQADQQLAEALYALA